ncbi:MAG: class I SAM-dependent methyltransferase [Holophagaceae bacterium]|nr:class I SAM-dependent methyltransferase [Holophagaceae bacterium]
MEPCRICGGALEPAFEGRVLDRIPVTYTRCAHCASLLLLSPTWLEESYSRTWTPDPDFGSLLRSQFVHRCLRRLRARPIRILSKRSRTLDVGAGRGLLLRMLLDDGHDAWGFDPYPQSIFAEDRISETLPDTRFAVITAIEVLEHTLDPVPFLRRLRDRLAPDGFLAISTELYDAGLHGPNWAYLAPTHGQHVTIFSRKGLEFAAQAADLNWVHSFDWRHQAFLHILVPRGRGLNPLKRWILRFRHWRGEHLQRKDALA